MAEDIKFIALNEYGIEVEYLIMDKFTKNNKNYIIYIEEGKEDIYASLYDIVDNKINIIPIVNDTDYDIVDEYLESL